MRVSAFFPVLLLVYTGPSHAVLGGLPEQFNKEATTVMSTVSSNYSVLDTTLVMGFNSTHIT